MLGLVLCDVWNRLFLLVFRYLTADIVPMEQVEQVNSISMKIHNSFVVVLCLVWLMVKNQSICTHRCFGSGLAHVVCLPEPYFYSI